VHCSLGPTTIPESTATSSSPGTHHIDTDARKKGCASVLILKAIAESKANGRNKILAVRKEVARRASSGVGDIARLLEEARDLLEKKIQRMLRPSFRLYLEAFSIICAMADNSAASAATPAHLDCGAKLVPRLNSLVRSASAKLKATLKAKPLAMKAEKKAIQKAALLFIAPSNGIFAHFASPSYSHSPIEIPTGMRGYNQVLTPDLQEGPN
jgi:hypothetical protein